LIGVAVDSVRGDVGIASEGPVEREDIRFVTLSRDRESFVSLRRTADVTVARTEYLYILGSKVSAPGDVVLL
jgi:hypothetical protein